MNWVAILQMFAMILESHPNGHTIASTMLHAAAEAMNKKTTAGAVVEELSKEVDISNP